MGDTYTDRVADVPLYTPEAAAASKSLISTTTSDLSSAADRGNEIPLYSPETAPPDKKVFELNAQWWQPIEDFGKDLAQHYAEGEKAVNDGAIGAQVLKGEKTYDQALKDLSDSSEQPYKDKSLMGRIFGQGVEMLPTIKYIAEGAAQGSVGGGAAGAAVGAAYGVIGGPAAGVTVPAAAGAAGLWGATVGGDAGAFTAAAEIAAGQSYMSMRNQGVGDATARAMAVGIGALNGYFQSAQINQLGGAAKASLKAEAESSPFLLGTAIKNYLNNIGVQTTLASAQQFASQIGHSIARGLDSANPPTIDDIAKGAADLWGATVKGAETAAVIIPAAHVAGRIGGKIAQRFIKEPTNIHEGAAAVHELTFGETPQYPETHAALTGTRALVKKSALELEGNIVDLETELSEAKAQGQPTAQIKADLAGTRKLLTRAIEREYIQETQQIKTEIRESAQRLSDLWNQVNKFTEQKLTEVSPEQVKLRTRIQELIDQMKQAKTLEDVQALKELREHSKQLDELQDDINRLKKQADRQKLGRLKEDIQGEYDLLQELAKQVKAREAKSLKSANKALSSAFERVDATRGKRKQPESKYDFDTQKVLDKYKEFALPRSPDKAQAHLRKSAAEDNSITKDVDAKAQNDQISPEMTTANREIADIIANDTNINYNDPIAVRQLADKINIIADLGKHNKMQAKLNKARELAATKELVFNTIQGTKPAKVENPVPPELPKLEELARVGGTPAQTFNTILGHIFQDAEDPSAAMAALDPYQHLVTTLKNIQDQFKKAEQAMTGGRKDLENYAKELMKNGDPEVHWGEFTAQDGGDYQYKRRTWDLVQDILDMRNAREGEGAKMYRGIKEGNKFTFRDDAHNNFQLTAGEKSFEELLDDVQLSNPKVKDLADNIMAHWNSDKLYDRTNVTYKDEFAMDMPRVKNYTGTRRRENVNTGLEGSSQDTFLNGMVANRPKSLVPDSAMAVVDSPKGYQKASAYDNMSQFIVATETWAGMRDIDKTFRAVFSDPNIRRAIEMKYGKDMLKIIDHTYSSIVGTQGVQYVQRIKTIDAVRQNIGSAFVNGKPLSAFKQMASVFQALHYISVEDFVNGMGEAAMHPIKVTKEMRGTDWWQVRYDSYATEMLEHRMMQGLFGKKLDPKIINAFATAIITGDKVASISMGWAVRQAKVREALAAGKTRAEAEAYGNMWAGKVVNETQSSALAYQMTHVERAGSFGKALVMFGKQPLQVGGQYVLSMRRYFSNPTEANRNTMIRTIAAAHVAQGVFTAVGGLESLLLSAVTGGVTEKDVWGEAYKTGLSFALPGMGFPVIGDFEYYIAAESLNKVAGKKILPAFAPTYLPFSIANSGAKFIIDMNNDVTKTVKGNALTTTDLFTGLTDFASGILPFVPVVGKLPVRPAIKYAKPFFVQPKQKKEKKSEALNPLT